MGKGYTIKMWRRCFYMLLAMIILGFGTIIFRLVKLQIVDGAELHRKAIAQQLKDTTLSAKRGTIYDRNLKPLAESATVWTVVLEPAYLKEENLKNLVVDGLSRILGISKDELYEKTQENSYYTVVARKIESDKKDEILKFKKEHKIDNGIRLIEDYKRYYPYGSFASFVIGVTGADSQGLFGLEKYYDDELTGDAGRLVTAKNAYGTDMPFDYEQRIDARNGYNLILSIDEVVQHFMEKALEEGIVQNKVLNRAAAIMIDVKTGDILGLAVKEDFDLNSPFEIVNPKAKDEIAKLPEDQKSKAKNEALEHQWRNKAICDTYFPGSVFKMITLAMGFEENLVNEQTQYNCTQSIIPGPGIKPIHCWKHGGHGLQNYEQAMCNSCNPAFISLGMQIGKERFKKYYDAFGFNKKTEIDLPGESNSVFFPEWTDTDLAVASMGQNFGITPIQMITAAAAIANGGNVIKPHIVKKILDDNGNIIKSNDVTVLRQAISSDTSKRVSRILNINANIGTGESGYVPGFRVCGKTGTTEKIGVKPISGRDKDYIASYCGFAPLEDPQYALLVFFDTPSGEAYGGAQVAGPVFQKIMASALPYLGVERRYTEKEMEDMAKKASSNTG